MRFCNECTKKITSNRSNSQVKEKKEFEANINELKQQPSNQFGHMDPYFKK